MSAFRGFPVQAVQFLVELEANNDRDWFKSNRVRYDEHLVAPAMALADDLSDLGPAHLFRPWNNTRFRPGPPLKEHLGLAIGYGDSGGFWGLWRVLCRVLARRPARRRGAAPTELGPGRAPAASA
jgi:hypothetical protein